MIVLDEGPRAQPWVSPPVALGVFQEWHLAMLDGLLLGGMLQDTDWVCYGLSMEHQIVSGGFQTLYRPSKLFGIFPAQDTASFVQVLQRGVGGYDKTQGMEALARLTMEGAQDDEDARLSIQHGQVLLSFDNTSVVLAPADLLQGACFRTRGQEGVEYHSYQYLRPDPSLTAHERLRLRAQVEGVFPAFLKDL